MQSLYYARRMAQADALLSRSRTAISPLCRDILADAAKSIRTNALKREPIDG